MKTGIITFHFVNNFGGALQAYALKSACEECGVEAHLIDYRQWFIRFTDMVRMFPVVKNPKVIFAGLRTMHARVRRKKRFAAFRERYLSMSRTYYSAKALFNDPPAYDKYICGSDQIWNTFITCGIESPYYLAFEKDPQKKFSYAPSFGSSTVPVRYLKRIREYLNELGDISVREKEAIGTVKKLTGRDALQLIDPTLLIPVSQWEALAESAKIRIPYKEFILVYIMQKDDTVYEYAGRLKEKYNIPVVEIGRYGYKASFVDRCIVDLGSLEFVWLFRNATHVCTNSYHGILFSILFSKKICIIPCKRFKSRIDSLTELFQIEQGSDVNDLALDVHYDRERIRETLAVEKEKSMNYLRKNLGVSK